MDLYDRLKEYSDSDFYPFHMPGHKRRSIPYDVDITEIDGFDNLHHPEGILKELMDEISGFYGTKKSYPLVNGSTCGILAALYAATPKDGKIFLSRNSHKAAYHGTALTGAEVGYIYPKMTDLGLFTSIWTEDIQIEEINDKTVVFITSPTYDGIVSDISSVAQAVHEKGGVLIVDEAHGAHLCLSERFPRSAVSCGADIVIQSLHKTLPSMTQTALLHICSDRVDPKLIHDALEIFETSSPSYVLLASIADCLRFMRERGKTEAERFADRLDLFYEKVSDLKTIHVLKTEELVNNPPFDVDKSKILVYGRDIYDDLLNRYHIQPEMRSVDHALLLAGLMDTEEGFKRLTDALFEMDNDEKYKIEKTTDIGQFIPQKNRIEMAAHEAVHCEREWVDQKEAIGRVAASYIYFYPPGVPVIVPGEVFDSGNMQYIKEMRQRGLEPNGGGYDRGRVLVCRSIV